MLRRLSLAPLLAGSLVACGAGEPAAEADKLPVVAAAYPFAWLAERIGGTDVAITGLAAPGTEPHDIELTPRQVAQIQGAAVVVYLEGFQPAVDDAVGEKNALNLGTGLSQLTSAEEPGAKDPHVWLNPILMQRMASAVADRLVALDPHRESGYRSRATSLVHELQALDAETTAALAHCESRDIVTSHTAFAYFAERFGLVQRGIAGLSPEEEPSPRRLAEVARFAKTHHVSTIFFESLVSPKLAETMAREVGATTAVLDPIEGVRGSDDYLTVMRRNVRTLHDALHCV